MSAIVPLRGRARPRNSSPPCATTSTMALPMPRIWKRGSGTAQLPCSAAPLAPDPTAPQCSRPWPCQRSARSPALSPSSTIRSSCAWPARRAARRRPVRGARGRLLLGIGGARRAARLARLARGGARRRWQPAPRGLAVRAGRHRHGDAVHRPGRRRRRAPFLPRPAARAGRAAGRAGLGRRGARLAGPGPQPSRPRARAGQRGAGSRARLARRGLGHRARIVRGGRDAAHEPGGGPAPLRATPPRGDRARNRAGARGDRAAAQLAGPRPRHGGDGARRRAEP